MIELAASWFPYVAKGISVLIAWLLVVAGWAVANDLAAQRDRRRAELEKVDRLRDGLAVLEGEAAAHHTQGFDDERWRMLTRRLKHISVECAHFERLGIISRDWRSLNLEMRKAVTDANYSAGSYAVEQLYGQRMSDIYHAIDAFRAFLFKAHEAKFAKTDSVSDTLKRIVRAG
ncbi:MAG: hypothetical protein ABIJ73_01655 [Pseudomonadota bacterium]